MMISYRPIRGALAVAALLSGAGGFDVAAQSVAQDAWPSFRGPGHGGVADGHDLPSNFDAPRDINLRWKTPIPGLGHSSPVVWGESIYLTTAIAETDDEAVLLTGPSDSAGIATADDRVRHGWRLYALDRGDGEIQWHRTVWEAVPRVHRHRKASHASATPATDGQRLVALIDSEGLFAFDMRGNLLWRTDVGVLDVGYWGQPEYQWGPASSPLLHDGMVFVQNDRQADSFVAAYDLETGDQVWRVGRDEKPAWSTPTLYRGARPELVLNGARYFTAYDPRSGRELWRLSNDDAQVIVPTPIVAGDRIVITGGNPTGARPITVIRPGGEGDLTPPPGTPPGEHLAWVAERGSPYTPTPLAYRGILYVIVDNGILSTYDLETGERLYRTRLAVGAGFSASPVASDGRIFFPSEDGDVFVVGAGRDYELLGQNAVGEILMASPAISDGALLVRGRRHLFAFGATTGGPADGLSPQR